MEAFIAGAWRSIGRGEIYIGGQWRRFTRGEAYIGGQWRSIAVFVSPLTVTAPDVIGTRTTSKPSSGVVVTNVSTATPSGGLSPHTYVWSITSGSASIGSPTGASTSFSKTLSANTEAEATAHVVCTDALGATAAASITLTFSNYSDI